MKDEGDALLDRITDIEISMAHSFVQMKDEYLSCFKKIDDQAMIIEECNLSEKINKIESKCETKISILRDDYESMPNSISSNAIFTHGQVMLQKACEIENKIKQTSNGSDLTDVPIIKCGDRIITRVANIGRNMKQMQANETVDLIANMIAKTINLSRKLNQMANKFDLYIKVSFHTS